MSCLNLKLKMFARCLALVALLASQSNYYQVSSHKYSNSNRYTHSPQNLTAYHQHNNYHYQQQQYQPSNYNDGPESSPSFMHSESNQNLHQVQYNPCQSSPSITKCLNGGRCVPKYNGEFEPVTFDCICPIGFEASLCEMASPSVCRDKNPCKNGATCQLTTSLNDYKCLCPEGYRGINCEQINHCRLNSCANGGECSSNEHSFTCNCTQGYTGETCQQDIDECALGNYHVDNSIFEQHHHQSHQSVNYHHQQHASFNRPMKLQHIVQLGGVNETSPLATIDYESHVSNRVGVCGPHGRCSNTIGSFVCTCDAGWTGKRCEKRYVPCDPNPCLNGGSCSQEMSKLLYKCQCPIGFTGTHCEINIDDCGKHQLCQNGGTCIDGINNYTCACQPQWTGPFCGQDVDECAMRPHVCHNGATCINKEGGYQCSCVYGWTGHDCSENIDDCSYSACGNGATCHDKVASFICQCPPGKTGLLCQLEDLCARDPPPCHPNAICDSSGVDGSPKCSCPTGFTGANCSIDINECAEVGSPCEHGGSCVNTPGSYRCECLRGFAGPRCEININECENNPCRNHGTCLDEEGGYRCVCMNGFTGLQCEIDVDECTPNPCQNGATCQEYVNSYRCICSVGHWGERCEFSRVCANNQFCLDHYADGQCNSECNNLECSWDGLDCDQEAISPADGVLVVKFSPSLENYDKQHLELELKKILRHLSAFLPGTVLKIHSVASFDDITEVQIVADNRKCQAPCIDDTAGIAAKLSATNLTSLDSSFIGHIVGPIMYKPEEKPITPSTIIIMLFASLTMLSLIMMVITRDGNKKKIKAKAVTWFPEGFFVTAKGVRRDTTNHKSGKTGVSTLQALSGNFFRGGRRNEKRVSSNPGGGYHSTDIDRHGINTPNAGGGIYHEPYGEDWQYESCNGTDSGSMLNHNDEPMTPPTMHVNPIDIEGPHGNTPLMVASMKPEFSKEPFELVKYGTTSELIGQSTVVDLLQRGAQVNISNKVTGETALHLAARYGRADHTRQLLERGADLNAQDATGRTPMHASIAADSQGVFELLANHRSIDINAQTNDGTTPLILAVKVGTDYIVDQLISFECDINKSDANGKTALHWAAATNNVYAIKKLLANGANKDTQDLVEETPLFLAAREGAKGAIEILLSHNANKDISDNMDRSPIDTARSRQHFDIVRLLEDHEPLTPKSITSVHQLGRYEPSTPKSITSVSQLGRHEPSTPKSITSLHQSCPQISPFSPVINDNSNGSSVQSTHQQPQQNYQHHPVYNVPSLKNCYLTPSPDSPFSIESLASPPATTYIGQQYQNASHPAGVFI